MLTLQQVDAEMRAFNERVAAGSTCQAWEDFVAETTEMRAEASLSNMPLTIGEDWASYWLQVAKGQNLHYDAITGDRLEH